MVTNKATSTEDFVISRDFDAPRELVWHAWTEPKALAQWWGPRCMTTPVSELDVRPGGKYRIVMRSAENVDFPMTGLYVEVLKPERLSYTVDCAEHPPAWHAKFRENLPPGLERPMGRILNTITFDDLGAGKTRVTVRMSFDDVVIRDAMLKMGMNQGWGESLDRLGEFMAKA
jgi:uncharacterized protein YndB with AHSA1/START domain